MATTTPVSATTTLYRAVKPAELAHIQATNSFQPLWPGMGKYFTPSAESAASFAKQASAGFSDGPYTIIQTTAPATVFDGLTPASVDRGIEAWVLPDESLRDLSPQVMESSPIPDATNPEIERP
jgi:hypothetical protein